MLYIYIYIHTHTLLGLLDAARLAEPTRRRCVSIAPRTAADDVVHILALSILIHDPVQLQCVHVTSAHIHVRRCTHTPPDTCTP